MDNLKKKFGQISILYGIIIGIVNYLGYLLASSGKLPTKHTEDYAKWTDFMDAHVPIITVLSIIGFLVPVVMCVSYSHFYKTESVKKRIINLPLCYSIFGGFGWISSFMFQSIMLVYAKFTIGLNISDIMISSCLNILQAGLFIFTLGFLVLYTISRKYVLPKLFPNENILLVEGAVKPSVRFLFGVFYFSVGLFPVFLLLFNLT